MLMTRYLLRHLFSVTVFVALVLTTVIWLTQSLKLLELVANSDAPPGLFLRLVFLSIPKFLEIILPISIFIATAFIYNKMIIDNELVVMRASGFDPFSLAKPALLLACAATLILLSLTTYITPKSYSSLLQLRQSVKTQYSSFLLREGVFNTFGNSLTVYLHRRNKEGELFGLMIHDTRDKTKPPVTVTAKSGHMEMSGDTPTIVVFEGIRQQMDTKSNIVTKLYFSKYTIEIKSLESNAASRWHDAGERTLTELLSPDMANRRDRDNRDLFLAEAQHRLLTPFNTLAFCLIGLNCLLLGPFNRRGQNKKIALSVGLVIVVQSLNLGLMSLMKKDLAFAPAFYMATLGPIAAGLYLLSARGEETVSALLRRWRRPEQEMPA